MDTMATLRPRLVILTKTENGGFGFNVTATRNMVSRHIGIVMDGSLAKQAGLRSGDRVCEVNGNCVDDMPLSDIQDIIRARMTVELLVADPMTDSDYKSRNEVIRGGMANTQVIRVGNEEELPEPVPPSPPVIFGGQEEELEMETEVVDADTFLSTHADTFVVPDDTPAYQPNGVSSPFNARLCTVKRWSDYSGYGFELHGDKETGGQNIGRVESGSPAEAAGLREGDKLIEVNGVNVENEFQQSVVQRIAGGPVPGETTLLVADPDALRFFRGHSIPVNSSMSELERIETPARSLVPVREPSAQVRLCHVKKWSDTSSYGFVLHGEKGVPGTTLSVIDPGSIAEAAGLRPGDKLIEINGFNVEGEEQPQAIARIQMGVDGDVSQTRLLVVDQASDLYFKRQNVLISGSMADVVYMTNPERPVSYTPYVADPEPQVETINEAPQVFANHTSSSRKARLCRLKKWDDFDGYGFFLHSEDGVRGTFIGRIDPGSPAEAAGLRSGDRIIEVNEQNAEDDDQEEIAKKVISEPEGTEILVADESTLQYFMSQGILVNSQMKDLDIIETPAR